MKAKLTKSLIQANKKTILQGFPDGILARCLGVSARTLRRWRAVAREAATKKKSGWTARQRMCVEFCELQRRGQAKLIADLWLSLRKAAETDWKAARYLLSVLSPEDFSARGIAMRAVQRDVNAEIGALSPAALKSAIERESLEVILSAVRAGDLHVAMSICKFSSIDASGFSPEDFLQGLRALKNSILNGDGGAGAGDDIERQLMSIESERA